jgi:SAM-dependent methyltransferase
MRRNSSRCGRVWVGGVVLLMGMAGCAELRSSEPEGHRQSGAEQQPHTHRFNDVAKWEKRFEDPQRDAWQMPEHVIGVMGLRPDARVADIGSATGYFPVRFARAVPRGVVYGIDVEPELVDYLNRRAGREGLSNLRSVLGAFEDPRIPEPVDVIFLCNTYHHIEDRVTYFRKLRSKLRPGGRLVVVDYYKRPLPKGPPPGHKLAAEVVERELNQAGYFLVLRDAHLPYQYLHVYEPTD